MGKNMCPGGQGGLKAYHYSCGNPWLWNTKEPWSDPRHDLTKRINRRVTCPVCKRRLMGCYVIDHDGEVMKLNIPPHKPKRWWKKKKCTSRAVRTVSR